MTELDLRIRHMAPAAAIEADDPTDPADAFRRDGYFILRDFFPRERIQAVRAELLEIIEEDLAARAALQSDGARPRQKRITETGAVTTLTAHMHSCFSPSWRSRGFAELAGDMIFHPRMDRLRGEVMGPGFRLRTDLIRRASGTDDSVDTIQLPHEWHRDECGEFTFGIFFDDMPHEGRESGLGGTAVVPGTHALRIDPRWHLALGAVPDSPASAPRSRPSKDRYVAGERWLDLGETPPPLPANREARMTIAGEGREIVGRMGDIYMFSNRVWHGRAANHSGRDLMIARVGGFSAGEPLSAVPWPEGKPLDARLAERFSDPHRAADTPMPYAKSLRERFDAAAPVYERASAEKDAVMAAHPAPA